MNSGLLTPRQLCDVLNYVLGLPEIIGNRTVIREAVGPWVVDSWPVRPTRSTAESFCDAQLAEAGFRSLDKKRTGRPPKLPRELHPWLPTLMKRRLAA